MRALKLMNNPIFLMNWKKNEPKFNDFDLLTSPQGHLFDPRIKILLALIWYATWPCLKKLIFDPPEHPKVPPLGHDQGDRMKIPSNVFYIFHLWENTQSLV